ncbi:MAG: uracil-DNA glycosylase [Devosiaceae bacterium]|nr:uracil-DNA glycosylase [Devosiaceae bacterium]
MTNHNINFDEDLAMLEYYQAVGVNLAVGEKAIDRFADAKNNIENKKQQTKPENKSNISTFISQKNISQEDIPQENITQQAKDIAHSAKDLSELEELMKGFDGCALKKRATQIVFCDGNPKSDIMIIGEAPSRDDDIEGRPFVGRSGQLLDRMLKAIGLDRSKVYITNIVAWRPPGNRNPTTSEIASCLPFLHRQIELIKPKIILTLGAPAAHTIFSCKTPISKLRGKWQQFELNNLSIKTLDNLSIKTLATFHPAFLLRQPAQKAQAWQDLLMLKTAIDELTNNA